MEKLRTYRFDSGILEGQSFGNLFLAAMTGTFNGDFVTAVRNVCEVLNITGQGLSGNRFRCGAGGYS